MSIPMVRSEGPDGIDAWSNAGVHLASQGGKLYVVDDEMGLNFEISDEGVRFLVGTPERLRKALLKLVGTAPEKTYVDAPQFKRRLESCFHIPTNAIGQPAPNRTDFTRWVRPTLEAFARQAADENLVLRTKLAEAKQDLAAALAAWRTTVKSEVQS